MQKHLKSHKRVSNAPLKNRRRGNRFSVYGKPHTPSQKINSVLSTLVRARDFDGKMLEQKIFALWGKIAGPPFANNTHPASLSGGILKVYTEYPPYKTELLFHKEKIIANLNAELGDAVLIDLRIELREDGRKLWKSAPTLRKGKPRYDGETEESPPAHPGDRMRSFAPAPTQGGHTAEGVGTLTPNVLGSIEQALSEITDVQLKTSLRQLFITQSQNNNTCRGNK